MRGALVGREYTPPTCVEPGGERLGPRVGASDAAGAKLRESPRDHARN